MNFLHKGALRFLAVNVQSELDSEIVFLIAFAGVAKLFFSCLSGYCILLPSVQKFSKQLFSFQNRFKKSLRLKICSLSWPS
jgi:hypothetical protein